MHENAHGEGSTDQELPSARYPTQTRLIDGIRRGEHAAIRELFLLYAPLLRDQARKMSIPAGERRAFVETVLADVAIHLTRVENPPHELTRYLVSALRNRARTKYRDEERHHESDERAYGQYGESSERIIAECHSEYGIRAARSVDHVDESCLRAVVAGLARKSASELSEDEITMMVGIGSHIPLRVLAEHLGINYGAARVRLSRLRARFVGVAARYINTLGPLEKRQLERFFQRADVKLGNDSKTERNSPLASPGRVPEEI